MIQAAASQVQRFHARNRIMHLALRMPAVSTARARRDDLVWMPSRAKIEDDECIVNRADFAA
jgi:hypothetical protein